MKRTNWITLLVFLILMPATLFLGSRLPGRSYYITATLLIAQMLVPFFLSFEGRKVQARELVIIAVLCAIAIAARAAIPIPHVKPMFAVIMLSGFAFGPQAGFMVGAIGAFGSNFFAGQGPTTPWQMLAYGAGGLLAGFLAQKGWLKKNRWELGIFGFLACVLWVGPLLDLSSLFLMTTQINWESALLIFGSGVPVNLTQGVTTLVTMLVLGVPLLDKLERIKTKYGML